MATTTTAAAAAAATAAAVHSSTMNLQYSVHHIWAELRESILQDLLQGRASQELITTLSLICLYFTALAGVLSLAGYRSLTTPFRFSRMLLLVLAVTGFFMTWSYYSIWIGEQLIEYMTHPGNHLSTWLSQLRQLRGSYIESAKDPRRWFYTSQLLNFAATLVVFGWTEGGHRVVVVDQNGEEAVEKPKRLGRDGRGAWFVSTSVYTILAYLGSVSTALALFLVQRSIVT
ncbi:hypothetical protein HDV05_001749, partial [Chytridiales sp. JEL 0842]